MGRARIDLKKINAKRIDVLVSDPANAGVIVDYFGTRDYRVFVATEASQLYSELSRKDVNPGFVFVSTQVAGQMARMMPDFVVKRFHAPVILFNESRQLPAPPPVSPQSLAPEIVPTGDLDPDGLLRTLENFDEVYQARLAEVAGPAAEPTSRLFAGPAKPEVAKESPPSKPEIVFQLVKDAFEPRMIGLSHDDVLTLHACKVSDPSGRGYFVFAFPARGGAPPPDSALAILEGRVREAAADGVVIEHVTEGIPARFFQELMDRSDEVMEGVLGDSEMILLYFRNRNDVTEPATIMAERNYLVPVEEWWCRLPLPCHTYVWLELNRRRILYVRPGDCLRMEAFERFKRKGLDRLMVDAADFANYRKIREMVHIADDMGVRAPRFPLAA